MTFPEVHIEYENMEYGNMMQEFPYSLCVQWINQDGLSYEIDTAWSNLMMLVIH